MSTVTVPTTEFDRPGPAPARLINSELIKIRTTNTWWIFLLGSLGTTALALLVNMVQAHFVLTQPTPEGMSPEDAATFALQKSAVVQATNIYTSGQFFGVLFVMLVGMIIVTNEFHHQTATTTYLATPHRTAVITAKLVAGTVLAIVFWAITTAIDLVAGAIFFSTEGYGAQIGEPDVVKAILFNLMAYVIWAIFGVGFGILIRSQLGATITGTVVYLLGYPAAFIIFNLIHSFLIKKDWVLTAMVAVPAVASQVAVSPVKTWAQSPPQWVGVAVLIGYAIVAGVIGILINRRRDVS
jgi:ABC-2 type transport system permease protein